MSLNSIGLSKLHKLLKNNILKLTTSELMGNFYYFDFHNRNVFVHKYVNNKYKNYYYGLYNIQDRKEGLFIVNSFDKNICMLDDVYCKKSYYCMLSNNHVNLGDVYSLTYGPLYIDNKNKFIYDMSKHKTKFELMHIYSQK